MTHDLTGTWTVDPAHSEIGFSVRHLMSKVRGAFTDVEATIEIGEAGPQAGSVRAVIGLDSIDTRNAQRDAHLRSSDFFGTDAHPTMTFVSTAITPRGDGSWTVSGDLELKGVRRPVDLVATVLGTDVDPTGAERLGAEVTGTLSRKEFGIDFNVPLDGGRVVVGDEITLAFTVEATRA